MKRTIQIYDTTLRDGTQGEGISFSVNAKLRVAEKLDQFGVDIIEGGWPGSNPRDMAFFEQVRNLKLQHAKIAAFGSTRRAKVAVEEDAQVKLLLEAETEVVTIFGKTWLLHVTEVIRTTAEENLAMIEDTVRYLVDNGKTVIYDAEHFFDGYLDNSEYALQTLQAAINGGASNVSLCETNGGKMVHEVSEIVAAVVEAFPDTPVGVHCHNDCGLGVAVSLAGVRSGASLVQGTINGYGERNGNANLTSIIPNLTLKMGFDLNCGKNVEKMRDVSLFVADMANLSLDIKAPYVGSSSFAHKGGVHADAAAKVARSYEHIDPSLVGNRTRVLVSDMSGRSSLMLKAKEIGYELDARSPDVKDFLDELKSLEFNGYEYESADGSFQLLLKKILEQKKSFFDTISYRVSVERDKVNDKMYSEATVKVNVKGEEVHTVAGSHGPVDALDQALRKALRHEFPMIDDVRLIDYKVRILSNSVGTDSIIRVSIDSADDDESWGTVGAGDNIIVASWEAIRDALEYKIFKTLDQK